MSCQWFIFTWLCGYNINCLELLVVFYSLQKLTKVWNVCMRADNSLLCNNFAKKIWNYHIDGSLMLHASNILGKLNFDTEFASRSFNNNSEMPWTTYAFRQLCVRDLASIQIGISTYFWVTVADKFSAYAYWIPDESATYIDVRTVDWNRFDRIYVFPPFGLRRWGLN